MRHLLVIVVVIYAVIGSGWAQTRGSSRYVPPEDFDGDITRAPRQTPTRGAAVRRQRPTKAPEPVAEDAAAAYQPQEIPSRTTARRVPQRGSPQQVAPPPPPPLPLEDTAPRYPSPAEELPQVPPVAPEGRPQGTRRRRPKKRRKPQSEVPKAAEEPEKQLLTAPQDGTPGLSGPLGEDRNINGDYQNNPQLRHASPNYNSEPAYQPEKTTWENNPSIQNQANAAGPQYFKPQPASNRLPVADADPVGDSRGYHESSPVIPDVDASAPYVPKRPSSSVSNEAAYVPVLSPIRVPSDGASRLPPEEYSAVRDKESSRPTHIADSKPPVRGISNISPIADPNEIIRNTGAKPLNNIIPQHDETIPPSRAHSEVRLPENEQPLISEYDPSSFDSDDLIQPNAKVTEDVDEPPNASHRLPNPSEIHYDSIYPEFSDRPARSSQRNAGRRQESDEQVGRNPHPSYSTPRRDTGTKPQEYDNDAQIDSRQASQYRPPLQRTGSRYKPEDAERPTRSRTDEYPPSTNVPRTRGSSRHQALGEEHSAERTRGSSRYQAPAEEHPPERTRGSSRHQAPAEEQPPERTRGSSRHQTPADEYSPERTRSSTRSRSEPNVESPTRSRSTSTSHSTTGARGSQRYVPDSNVSDAPRSSTRRQPTNSESSPRNTPSAAHLPVDEIVDSPRPPPLSSRAPNQPPEKYESDGLPQEIFPIRNTLRSRPQYEVRDTEPAHTYAESVEDPDVYNAEYPVPRQPPARGRTNERNSVSRQQPPLPEYQVPQNRQQIRPESQYVPPQRPRSRPQPQYDEPRYANPDPRQANNRQNQPSSRQQGRPRQNPPEASAAPKSSSGRSNFVCPESFGFFADPVQCDKYYECRNGTAEMHLCSDGLAFNEISAPKFLRCDSLRDVDCKSRPELQEPQPGKNCPRRFGLFPHETDCTKFWNCVDGAATEVQCPPGLTYNDDRATCDWADLVESSCKTEDLLGFSCPEPTAHDLQDGVYTRYPHPNNCQLHFTCIKGADGLRRPRMLSCNEGFVFDPATATCTRPEEVPGCEDFYGDRRPAPRRKPAPREPEEEIVEEEPTPKPRRRGSNRRARN